MPTKNKKFISFYIGDDLYALPIGASNKFIEFENISSVPDLDKDILGLIYHNGSIVTIIDLRKALKIKAINRNLHDICLLFEKDGYHYGVLVDHGSDTLSAPRVYTDRQKKKFKKYIRNKNKEKIYILEPEEILAEINIYD